MRFFRPLYSLIDRIICVVAAIAAMQFPVYINQYIDVLSGALQEAKINYEDLQKRAAEIGMTVQEFVDHHLVSNDSVFHQSGLHYQDFIARYEGYQKSYEVLSTSPVWRKPFDFLRLKNSKLKVLQFKLGLPLTVEGVVYGLLGVVAAILLLHLISIPFRKRKEPLANASVPEKTVRETNPS